MSDTKKKKETIKVSCYLDENSHTDVKKKASDIGLSISAYIRFLIKQDLFK